MQLVQATMEVKDLSKTCTGCGAVNATTAAFTEHLKSAVCITNHDFAVLYICAFMDCTVKYAQDILEPFDLAYGYTREISQPDRLFTMLPVDKQDHNALGWMRYFAKMPRFQGLVRLLKAHFVEEVPLPLGGKPKPDYKCRQWHLPPTRESPNPTPPIRQTRRSAAACLRRDHRQSKSNKFFVGKEVQMTKADKLLLNELSRLLLNVFRS